jgi:protein phosphatase
MAQFTGAIEGVRVHGATQSSVGLRHAENEDAVGFFPDLSLYAVADGVGGHAAGRIASTLSIEAIHHSVLRTAEDDLTPVVTASGFSSVRGRRLLIALHDANGRVFDAAREDPQLRGMGAAVAAVLFDPQAGAVAICHVGDTRVYRIRGERIEQLTEDQTVVQQLVRDGRIRARDIPNSPFRHVLTQAVGIESVIEPMLRVESLEPGDVFILSSDGLHDVLDGTDILPVVQAAAGNLTQVCARLIALADERGRTDDTTVLVLACAGRGATAASSTPSH